MSNTNALILIGGQSERLGIPKENICYHDKPQYAHLHELLTSAGLTTYLSCNQSKAHLYQKDYPLIVDNQLGIGPIGGVAAAFAMDDHANWLIVACDMPFINENTIKKLLNCNQEKDIITYQSSDKPFPEVLITIYKKETGIHLMEAIEEKRYSLQVLLKTVATHYLTPNFSHEFFNVNTPEDLDIAKILLEQ